MLTRFRRNVTFTQALHALNKSHAMLRLSVHDGIKYVVLFFTSFCFHCVLPFRDPYDP